MKDQRGVVNKNLKPKTQERLKKEVEEFEGKYFIELNPWFYSYSNCPQDKWDKIFRKKNDRS